MISYKDKAFGRTLLVLPGWGFDPRVCGLQRFDFDLLIPERPLLHPLPYVITAMKTLGLEKISVLGWSLGARIAADMVESVPEIFHKTILVSTGVSFSKRAVSEKLLEISRDGKRALKTFYLSVFDGDRRAYKRFKRKHEKRCMAFWSQEELCRGLELIENGLEHLPCLGNMLLIHGKYDNVSPLNLLLSTFGETIPELLILPCGHYPFFEDNFYEAVNNF